MHDSLCCMRVIDTQLRKGVIEPCILGLLSKEPLYGWRLAEELTANGLIASIGTLYPVLTRMRSKGLIEVFTEAGQPGPVRKYYRLTKHGAQELKRFNAQWPTFVDAVSSLTGMTP